MKEMKHILLTITAILCYYQSIAQCDFLPVGCNEYDQASQYSTNAVEIAMGPNNMVYITEGNYQVTVKRYNSNKWESVGEQTLSQIKIDESSIAVNKNTGVPFILMSLSNNGGKARVMKYENNSWVLVGDSNLSVGKANFLSISIHNNIPYILFQDEETNYQYSLNVMKYNGTNWEAVGDTGVIATPAYSPTMEIDKNGTIYVAYSNPNNSNLIEAVKLVGNTWVSLPATISKSEPYNTNKVLIKTDNFGIPYIAYTDKDSSYRAAVIKLTNGNWSMLDGKPISTNYGGDISMAFDPNNDLLIAYRDFISLKVKKYSGNSYSLIGNLGILYNTSGPNKDKGSGMVIANNGIPYVAFVSNNDDNKASVVKYQNTNWTKLGTDGILSNNSYVQKIVLDNNNSPHVFFIDKQQNNRAKVGRYIAGNWELLGDSAFSTGKIEYGDMAYDMGSNTVYVIFSDKSNSNKPTVMKHNGNTWSTVGGTVVSDDYALYNSIAIDNNGMLYISYIYYDANSKKTVAVKKFNGTNWTNVGNVINNTYSINTVKLALSPNGTPHILFYELATDLTIMKFNGSTWVNVGTPNFNSNDNYASMVIINNNIYVGYINNNIYYIKKYNGSSWTNFSTSGLTNSSISSLVLNKDMNDILYIIGKSINDNYKLIMKKYTGSIWETIGKAGFNASGNVGNVSYTFDTDNRIYVAFNAGGSYVYEFTPKVDSTTIRTAPIITAVETDANYQWLDCDNGFSQIAGANSQSYTATVPGHYAVIISKAGCETDTSACVSIPTNSTKLSDKLQPLQIYPNPNNGLFTIILPENMEVNNITIVNMMGASMFKDCDVVGTKKDIDLSNFPRGMYLIKVATKEETLTQKIILE